MEFLTLSRALLTKCREAMKIDGTSPNMTEEEVLTISRQSSLLQKQTVPSSTSDPQHAIWMAEMEKGFDTLLDAVGAYLPDFSAVERLRKK